MFLRARRSGQEGGAWPSFFGASRRVRGREARRGLHPGDVRSSLRQRGEVCSPARRAKFSSARAGGRKGARSAAPRRHAPRKTSPRRRAVTLQATQAIEPPPTPTRTEEHIATTPGCGPAGRRAFAHADTRDTSGEGLVACISINFGRPGALLGTSVAFGSGCGQALPGVPRKAPLVFFGACRRGRRLGGLNSLQVHNPASWRCAPRCSVRVGVGEGSVA